MPSVDSVNKTNAVCSVPGGVLGAEDAGASEPGQASPCPVQPLCYWKSPGAGSKIPGMSDGAKYDEEKPRREGGCHYK